MATIKNYRELEVWKLSMSFVEVIYKALKTFPPEERYGICDQIRRAAVSGETGPGLSAQDTGQRAQRAARAD